MKYILSILLCCTFLTASAQKTVKNIDTIYYLLDTANTSLKDRMWDIGIESKYKYYTIKCPCLNYGNEPTFVYDVKNQGEKHDNDFVLNLRTISLSMLIDLAKKATDMTAQTLYIFYLIEKNNSEYRIRKVRLLTPRKHDASIDYENVPEKKNR